MNKKLVLMFIFTGFLVNSAMANPSLEVYSGDIQLNGNDLKGVSQIFLKKSLTDGNISDSITISSSGQVEMGSLTDTGTLSFDWSDSEVSNSVTVNSVQGFVSASPALNAGNISLGAGVKNNGAGSLTIEPSDFAGTGLEDDGSDNLRIATSAAGNGLTGGGGSSLAVADGTGLTISSNDVSLNAGTGINLTSDSVSVDLKSIAGTALTSSADTLNVQASSISHGSLSGLTGSDDHTQYLEKDGSDSLTGNLDLGSFNVTNVDSTDFNDVTNKIGGDTCTTGNEGQIAYNGTHHLGCDGSNWYALY